ncbi:MAG TPA: tRNA (adenosine(37)-N6)-threonylcarbamoyltransferase complex dimerization subunit type 1 TsaB [Gammaproteobacteria bacterium]|nr:tRNA (adenosine(37)-N6)-threonylcarbamoyltransferase complex dimerization subunit type 1 TsaB [Gammaproteobacteria bacterium]
MKLLAFDTSSTTCSVALLLNDEIIEKNQTALMQQAQLIFPMIDTLLKSKNLKINQLDGIAFGCGPGSFTGVRIATSVAQGLAYAAKLPLIPVSSLAALAQAAYEDLRWEKLVVAVDARIQEIYWGAYKVNSEGRVEAVGDEIVCPPNEICTPFSEKGYGVCNAWEIYQDQLSFKPLDIDATRLPSARGILRLAKDTFLHQGGVAIEDALPRYLRDEVAKKR